jgi:hypothetical protein
MNATHDSLVKFDRRGRLRYTLEQRAALNMATVCLAKQFAGTPLIITTISPG